MRRARGSSLVLVAVVALLGLAGTVPFSPAGSLPQWDNLVLALVAGWAAWRCGALTRAMSRRDRLPWQVLSASALVFAVASLCTGVGIGGALGGMGLGD